MRCIALSAHRLATGALLVFVVMGAIMEFRRGARSGELVDYFGAIVIVAAALPLLASDAVATRLRALWERESDARMRHDGMKRLILADAITVGGFSLVLLHRLLRFPEATDRGLFAGSVLTVGCLLLAGVSFWALVHPLGDGDSTSPSQSDSHSSRP